MNDKVRKEFEAWVSSFSGIPPGKLAFLRVADGYAEPRIESAWFGWQASRALLAVELPSKISQHNTDANGYVNPVAVEYDECIDECRDAIHAAGVKTK